MDFFSFNYKPKDFKGKSTKDILAMKPTKVGDDFFTKYAAEIKEGDQALSDEELSAVQLLSDLKDKTKILEKCYTKHTKQSVVPGHHSIKKHPQAAAAAAPAPAAEEVLEEEGELVPEQTGGRRRRSGRRSGRRSSKRSSKRTRNRTMRLRSSSVRSRSRGMRNRSRRARRRGSKRIHGGADIAVLTAGIAPTTEPQPLKFKLAGVA